MFTKTWAVCPCVRTARSQDGAVLLDVERGSCCTLNEVGTMIWTAIADSPHGLTVNDIVQMLEICFTLSPCQLEADVVSYLDRLKVMGLIYQV